MSQYSFDAYPLNGGRESCSVGHLRELGKDDDVRPRHNLGGLRARWYGRRRQGQEAGDLGEIDRIFPAA
jgi:hypothetical protein